MNDPSTLRLVPRSGDLIDRRDMTDGNEITERMARDVLRARRDGIVGPVDLTEHGWTPAQVQRWGAIARDLAATPAFATQDVVIRFRESEGAATHPSTDDGGAAA